MCLSQVQRIELVDSEMYHEKLTLVLKVDGTERRLYLSKSYTRPHVAIALKSAFEATGLYVSVVQIIKNVGQKIFTPIYSFKSEAEIRHLLNTKAKQDATASGIAADEATQKVCVFKCIRYDIENSNVFVNFFSLWEDRVLQLLIIIKHLTKLLKMLVLTIRPAIISLRFWMMKFDSLKFYRIFEYEIYICMCVVVYF